jgi:transcriptional regulator EpsA
VNETVMLEEIDWVRFSNAVDASFRVENRQQFFVWSQSAVQGLVPHQILLCGIREPAGPALRMQHFTASRYFRQEHFETVTDPRIGMLKRLLSLGSESGESVVFSPSPGTGPTDPSLAELVKANELQNLAAMMVHGVDGQLEAFYGFARVSAVFDARLRRLIAMMVPHLHSTLVRVMTKERPTLMAADLQGEGLITPRQAEILLLIKEGKTTAQIAALLDCSPWTIKNHIQGILRRLKTNNRAHALVVAMRLGILRPD